MLDRTRVLSTLIAGLAAVALPACIPDVVPTEAALPGCTAVASACGPAHDESCCASQAVPGGLFNRGNAMGYPATVSDFTLDRFEVTVGRFRQFVADYPQSKPAAGAGASSLIAGSGWDSAWDTSLPADQTALEATLECDPNFRTWTASAGSSEELPINCVGWFVAFAFCAWDGGRLPTDAEWSYAASAGNEQRTYPWGFAAPDPSHAVYGCSAAGEMPNTCMSPTLADIPRVGSRSPVGDGKWGHADLAGSMFEWTLDWFADFPLPCTLACANVTGPDPGNGRSAWGGDWSHDATLLVSSERLGYSVAPSMPTQDSIGFRCARAQ
jgi:formylglycine-generating enzyme